MQFDERTLSFSCTTDGLFGIASIPAQSATRGVLIVVGGPQYRAGSHRQFTLLARSLAAQGIPVLRFDYRGMGDSEGDARDFEAVNADLRAAVDQFYCTVPSLRDVVLWGLCDGASAALFYAAQDTRVSGLVLLNPWVRTTDGLAKATLKHYYRDRLLQPELWKKIFSGQFKVGASLRSLLGLISAASGKPAEPSTAEPADSAAVAEPASAAAPLPERMYDGFNSFTGKVLLVISGNDLTAQEFLDMAHASRPWKKLLAAPRVTRHDLAQADHTFSRRAWRDQVANWTGQWMQTW